MVYCSQQTNYILISFSTHKHLYCSGLGQDETDKPYRGSITNLSVSPEVSNKINKARSLFGGSAFSLNRVNDRPLTPARHANSVSDLTDMTRGRGSGRDTVATTSNANTTSNDNQVHHHPVKPTIKTPVKFEDELKVITANNEPAKNRSTFGSVFKNFFK